MLIVIICYIHTTSLNKALNDVRSWFDFIIFCICEILIAADWKREVYKLSYYGVTRKLASCQKDVRYIQNQCHCIHNTPCQIPHL